KLLRPFLHRQPARRSGRGVWRARGGRADAHVRFGCPGSIPRRLGLLPRPAPGALSLMAEKLRIDFISDVVCPWCVIGLRALAIALDRVGADVEFHLQPFELNPDMAPEGENVTEHVARKYGSSAERSQGVRQAIKDHGAALGFTFNTSPESRIWNTFDAHRLLHWADLEGKGLPLKEA